jgi:hypothetical protein
MKCSFKKLSIIIMIFPCFNNDFDQTLTSSEKYALYSGYSVFSTYNIDHSNITEILLNMNLNTDNPITTYMKCSFKKLSIIIMIFPCFNNDFDQIYIGHTFLHLDASIEKLCTSFPIKHIGVGRRL